MDLDQDGNRDILSGSYSRQSQDMAGTSVIVRAHVPLKEMFGYISNLRGMTKGRASFSMQFHHYDPVPRNVADEIMKKSA